MELKRITVDTSKSVFAVHGIDTQDQPVLRRNFSRGAFEAPHGPSAGNREGCSRGVWQISSLEPGLGRRWATGCG